MQFFTQYFSRPLWRYGVLAVAGALVVGYLFFWGSGPSEETFTITKGDFQEQVSVSGTVTAARAAALGFAASGRVAGVYAKVGEYVGAGTVLAETENGDLVGALRQAEANLASLRAGTRSEEVLVASVAVENATAALIDAIQSAYTTSDDAVHNKIDTFFLNARTDPKLSFLIANTTLKTSVERQRADIELVCAKWQTLLATLSSTNAVQVAKQSQDYIAQVVSLLANANTAVNQGLVDQTTSAATLASYSTTLASARTNVNAAVAALTNAAAALSAAESTLALKKAGETPENIAAAEAMVIAARASLAKTRVVAPFGGIVTRMDAKVGEIISPTSSQIEMQSDGVFQIETYIPEVAIARVTVGNAATTTLDAYGPSVEFASTVIAVDPAETDKDGVPAYKTTLSFLTKDSRIRSGMTVNVAIQTGLLHDAIVIPAGAIGNKGGVPYVTVVTEGGDKENRTVTTGASPSFGQAQILSGLSAGEVILLAPAP